MLLATYYAQNYAGIIGWSLSTAYEVVMDTRNMGLNLHKIKHT